MMNTSFKPKPCNKCQSKWHTSLHCPSKPRRVLRTASKPMKRVGKQGKRYIAYRASIYPELVKRDGEQCKICGKSDVSLDVDHILKRGSHPELKYELSNLQLLCRPCHNVKDNT